MTITVQHKRGDTFLIGCAVTEDSVARDLTGYTVRAKVKNGKVDVATLTHSWVSQVGGTYQLKAVDTTLWPAAKLQIDIEYTDNAGVISSTETFIINCIADVTTP